MLEIIAESSRRGLPWARHAFAVAAMLVVGVSLLPGRYLLNLDPWDKLGHLIAYGLLAFLGSLAFPGTRAGVLLTVMLPALGIVMELSQMLVPGRSADIRDAAANTLGVGLVLVPLFLWHAVRRSRSLRMPPDNSRKQVGRE